MKKIKISIFVLLAVMLNVNVFSQSVGINADDSPPDSRTILHLKSNNKGVLLPNLTTDERNALYQNVPNSMLIYNTTVNQFQVFINNNWYPLNMGTPEPAPAPTMTDIDGNVYNTVQIGTQIWMKENLKVLRYRNGDPIPNVTNNTTWYGLTTGAYCWYGNNYAVNGVIYGALYNWYAVTDSRNVCPDGWHIPSDAELTVLTTYLGGETVAGGKMKEAGTAHWSSPNTGATNESGYTALPGGNTSATGYSNLSTIGNWWSSTQVDALRAYPRQIDHLNANIYSYHPTGSSKANGFSVRCVKDNN